MKTFIVNVVAGICFVACMVAEVVGCGFRCFKNRICYGVGYGFGYCNGVVDELRGKEPKC